MMRQQTKQGFTDQVTTCFVSSFHFLLHNLTGSFFFFFFLIPSNPTPGKVINRPNGTDVYEGVPKDYTGDVSASVQTFEQIKAPE